MEWINVEEKLPEEHGKYLVCTDNIGGYKPLENDVFIADFAFGEWIFDRWEHNRVTHWMELPEKPSQGKPDNIAASTKTDLANIKRIDFVSGCCNSDGEFVKGTERSVSILFNKTVISAQEVNELINNGEYEYDSRVIVTTPAQANNLKDKQNKLNGG
jgi:hypothetical protein